jgi:hypothetical protein
LRRIQARLERTVDSRDFASGGREIFTDASFARQKLRAAASRTSKAALASSGRSKGSGAAAPASGTTTTNSCVPSAASSRFHVNAPEANPSASDASRSGGTTPRASHDTTSPPRKVAAVKPEEPINGSTSVRLLPSTIAPVLSGEIRRIGEKPPSVERNCHGGLT